MRTVKPLPAGEKAIHPGSGASVGGASVGGALVGGALVGGASVGGASVGGASVGASVVAAVDGGWLSALFEPPGHDLDG
ncbi:MAG: hypothetical protein ABSE70_05940, partial [Candidatus Limnocylindrales bacterium]